MKKIILLILVSFSLANLSLYAEENKKKCMTLKGFTPKVKCLNEKYKNARKNASSTGLEAIEKMKKK